MAATKSSKDARQVGLSWHEKRCEVREKSTKGKYFRSSLQCLDNNEILLLLESILQRSKQGTQTNCTVRGLRTVQEHLMHGYGYLHLEEAYNLYSSFNECSCPNKQAFRDKLLAPRHGLTLLFLIKAYYTIFCFNTCDAFFTT